MTAIDVFRVAIEPYYRPVGDEVTVFEAAYRHRLPVMLKGPTGCGKTRFLEYMAWRLDRPLITVAAHEDMTAADLVGRFLLVPGETVWHDGPLTLAVRGGAICYIDEIVEARQDTTVVIHPLTDARRMLPLEKKNELVAAHADFQLVISYNPGYQSAVKDLEGIHQAAFRGHRFRLSRAAGGSRDRSARERRGCGDGSNVGGTRTAVAQPPRPGSGGGSLHPHADPRRAAGVGGPGFERSGACGPGFTADRRCGVARSARRRHRRLPGMTSAEATTDSDTASSRLLAALRRRPTLEALSRQAWDAITLYGDSAGAERWASSTLALLNANAGVACLAALLRLRDNPATLARGGRPCHRHLPPRRRNSRDRLHRDLGAVARPGTLVRLLPAGTRGTGLRTSGCHQRRRRPAGARP